MTDLIDDRLDAAIAAFQNHLEECSQCEQQHPLRLCPLGIQLREAFLESASKSMTFKEKHT